MRKRSQWIQLWLLSSFLAACFQKDMAPEFAQAELLSASFSIVTGKPGSPGESINLLRENLQCFIELKRFQDNTTLLTQDRQEISCSRLDQFWQEAIKQDILNFKPIESTQSVFDFGERQLAIQWNQTGESPKRFTSSWYNQLENQNQNQIQPVIDELVEIVQSEYHGNLQLYYFN